MTTAREKVRVARALKDLPLISASFSVGELSYAKVRALTRVAHRSNEEALLEFALRHTATNVAERCRELRMGDVSSIAVAERAFANRSLRICRNADRGMMTGTVDLPLEAGELVEKALDKARDDECLQVPDLVDTSWSMRQADAFVTLLREYLQETAEAAGSGSDNYLVTIHVDQAALAGNEGRSALPIESVKRLCCDGHAVVLAEDAGQPLGIGRKSRIVPRSLDRAVRARDHNRCVFPGCRNRRFLYCHHVEHWANGGETSLDNLILLCTKHHALVHEGGFRTEKDYRDRWYFVRPDGIAVPDCGCRTRDMIDGDVSKLDENPPAGGLLSVAEKLVGEPPPPVYLH